MIVGRAWLVGVGSGVNVAGVCVPVQVEGDKMKSTTDIQLSALKLGGVVKALKPGWETNASKGGNIEGGDNCDNWCCHC